MARQWKFLLQTHRSRFKPDGGGGGGGGGLPLYQVQDQQSVALSTLDLDTSSSLSAAPIPEQFKQDEAGIEPLSSSPPAKDSEHREILNGTQGAVAVPGFVSVESTPPIKYSPEDDLSDPRFASAVCGILSRFGLRSRPRTRLGFLGESIRLR